ncbi:hypothetical protein KY338_05890 [Candidatus Woesearchaeota archaeon]|nr:hypothetical protein [Candidatus Woesearchaeota archaeon]MBW3006287.1 hypothetical protein [Candidatus Woesearchaeota archaeon]
MKRKHGFVKKGVLGLAALAALVFGGCNKKDKSPQLVQDDQGNYVSTSTRQELNESLFEHYGTLTKTQQPHLLQDTTITEAGNQSLVVSQTLDFGTLTPRFAKDNLGNLGVYLHAAHDDVLYTMNWAFEDGFTSAVDGNGNLIDLLQKELNIGGKNFIVTRAKTQWMGGDIDEVQLDLMTGGVTAEINVDDSVTIGFEGIDYDIKLISTSANGDGTYSAKWQVNGEITDNLAAGALDILVNGQFIGTANASSTSARFSIGAQTIRIKDTDVNDNDYSGTVRGNGVFGSFLEDTDAKARIRATVNGSEITINSLAYQLLANSVTDTDIFVPATERLSDHLDNPGANLVEVGFDGLRTKKDDGTGTLVNRVYSSMDFTYGTTANGSSYTMTFTNKENITYNTVDFIENVGTSATDRVLEKKLVMTEASCDTDYNIHSGDTFVLTTALGRTFVLQYTGLSGDDTEGYDISFIDKSGTITQEFSVDPATGKANILKGGITFEAYVDMATGDIAVDQNADGEFDGSDIPIIDQYGARISIADAQDSHITANVSTSADKIDGSSVDEVVDLTFNMSGSGMNVVLPQNPGMYQGVGRWQGQTRYGVRTTRKDDGDIALNYPEIQEEPVATLSER